MKILQVIVRMKIHACVLNCVKGKFLIFLICYCLRYISSNQINKLRFNFYKLYSEKIEDALSCIPRNHRYFEIGWMAWQHSGFL